MESQTFTVPAGRFLLHIASDGPLVPDLQSTVELQADTAYHLCFFVTAGRTRDATAQ